MVAGVMGRTLEQIEARQNQACALEVETLEDAVALMSEAEKRAILDGGPPDAATYAQGVADPGYYADSMVYALLESAV